MRTFPIHLFPGVTFKTFRSIDHSTSVPLLKRRQTSYNYGPLRFFVSIYAWDSCVKGGFEERLACGTRTKRIHTTCFEPPNQTYNSNVIGL
jgi:hypothetical protein